MISVKNKEGKLEKHICRLCGKKMNSAQCILHRDMYGHDDFRLAYDAENERKG